MEVLLQALDTCPQKNKQSCSHGFKTTAVGGQVNLEKGPTGYFPTGNESQDHV